MPLSPGHILDNLFHRLFATRTNFQLGAANSYLWKQLQICRETCVQRHIQKRHFRQKTFQGKALITVFRIKGDVSVTRNQPHHLLELTCHVWKDTSHCSGEPVWLRVPQQPHNAGSAVVPGKTRLWKVCNRIRDSSLPVWVAMDTTEEKQNNLRRKEKILFYQQ